MHHLFFLQKQSLDKFKTHWEHAPAITAPISHECGELLAVPVNWDLPISRGQVETSEKFGIWGHLFIDVLGAEDGVVWSFELQIQFRKITDQAAL